jgi:hypothetical protein
MKRITVLALALTILALGSATQTFGTAQFFPQPETSSVVVNTAFKVQFRVKDNVDDVFAWQIYLGWDSLILKCDSARSGGYLSGDPEGTSFNKAIGPSGSVKKGQILTSETYIGYFTTNAASGDLVDIWFHGLTNGSTKLTFDPAFAFNSWLDDQDLNDLPLTLDQKGYVTILSASGVEQGGAQRSVNLQGYKVTPNPFASFATIPGHEGERFALYDISGKLVGSYRGNRIGEGLSAGVYFLRPEGKDTKPLRIVKIR